MGQTYFTRLNILVLLCMFTFTQNTWAKRFTNQYCEFELPSGWECSLEGSEWVCQHINEASKKEAIIILAAKIKGSQDSLGAYKTYLNNAKNFNLPGGKRQVSEPKYSKAKKINGHDWIDSLHLASEVPGFYTRYLATVKEDLGVAVTFSVAKDFYHAYQGLFDKIVSSLRVFRQKKKTLTKFRVKRKEDKSFADATFVPAVVKHDLDKNKSRRGDGDSRGDMLLYLILGVVGIGVFIWSKKKKKKKKKKVKKKKKE
jgi:hypothetical protein